VNKRLEKRVLLTIDLTQQCSLVNAHLLHSAPPHLTNKHLQHNSNSTKLNKTLPPPTMGQTSSSSNWDGSKMPSQAGKIAIVTGANSGTGYLVARALAGRGAYVVLACRSESRGRTAEQAMTAYLTALKKKQKRGIGSVE
jgi:hypothetical protein